MFIGHYSAAFAGASHPKAPGLGTLFVAAQLVDVGFFTFLPLGIEHMSLKPGISAMNAISLDYMPFTHSLVGALAWSVVFALLIRAAFKSWIPAAIAGAVVLSHWFLDLLVHVPDLTLTGAPPKLGFGLWNHPAIEMPLELGLLGLTIFLYVRATKRVGSMIALPVLVGFLLLIQGLNWFGAQPVAVDASVWAGALGAYAIAALCAWWVARTRAPR